MATKTAFAPATALAANGTAYSAVFNRDNDYPRGFGSIQYVLTGQVQLDIEYSLDGTTWFSKQTVAAGQTSGLLALDVFFAPMLRIKASEKAAAAATVGVQFDG